MFWVKRVCRNYPVIWYWLTLQTETHVPHATAAHSCKWGKELWCPFLCVTKSIYQQLKDIELFTLLVPLPSDDIRDDCWKPKLYRSLGPLTAIITLLTSSEKSSARGISYMECGQSRGKDGWRYEGNYNLVLFQDKMPESKARARQLLCKWL